MLAGDAPSLKRLQREQFFLESGEEGLGDGVVPTVGLAAHARSSAELLERGEVVVAAVPAISVGVVNPVRFQGPRRGRRVQRRESQLRVDAVRHGPADDAPRVQVQQDGEVQPAVTGLDVRDVAGEYLVGRRRVEVALKQIRSNALGVPRVCGLSKTSWRMAAEPEITHHSSDTLRARPGFSAPESAADTRRAVTATVFLKDFLHLGFEHGVVDRARAGFSVQPLVVTAARYQ